MESINIVLVISIYLFARLGMRLLLFDISKEESSSTKD